MQFTYKNTGYTVDAVQQQNGTFRWRFDAMLRTSIGSSDLPTYDLAIEIGVQRAREFIDSQIKA